MSVIRVVIAFLVAAAAASVAAAIANTQLVINALIDIGAVVTFGDRLSMTLADLGPFVMLYGAFIAIAFLIAFLVAALASRILPVPRALVFAAAGGTAIFVTLLLMREAFFGVDLITSARTGLGIALQCAAGVLGGALFAAASGPRERA